MLKVGTDGGVFVFNSRIRGEDLSFVVLHSLSQSNDNTINYCLLPPLHADHVFTI